MSLIQSKLLQASLDSMLYGSPVCPYDNSSFSHDNCFGVLFSPMVSGWPGGRASGRAGGRREIVCPGCISETVRCRKLILGRDIG